MKKFFGICAVAALTLFVQAAPASAQEVMMAMLTGGEETPQPGILTGATGQATVTVDAANRQVIVELQIQNLGNASTAGHIHIGPRGVAGPVVLDFTFPSGRTGDFGLLFRLGQSAFRARPEIGIATIDDAIQAILNGNAYVNVHSSAFPGGEVRGQIVRTQ